VGLGIGQNLAVTYVDDIEPRLASPSDVAPGSAAQVLAEFTWGLLAEFTWGLEEELALCRLYESSDLSRFWASSQMWPAGSVKLAVRIPHGRSTGPLISPTR
jgi:hypothetical protein